MKCLKPIFHYSIRWRRKWSASDSAIHSLATFTALLIVKVAAISIQLHSTSEVYNINGTKVDEIVSFEPLIQPSHVKYKVHAFATYIPVIIFILIPAVLLCLYPSRHFQNFLRRCCGPRKRLALAIFVDTISSGYRDGLDGGRDWRRLFPLLLFLLVGLHFIYISKHLILPETMLIIMAPLLLLMSFIVMYFRPYKTKAINMSNAFHLTILSICCLTIALWIQDYYLNARSLVIILIVCLSLPHVVMLLWVLKNVVQRCQSLKNCYNRTKHFFGKSEVSVSRF